MERNSVNISEYNWNNQYLLWMKCSGSRWDDAPGFGREKSEYRAIINMTHNLLITSNLQSSILTLGNRKWDRWMTDKEKFTLWFCHASVGRWIFPIKRLGFYDFNYIFHFLYLHLWKRTLDEDNCKEVLPYPLQWLMLRFKAVFKELTMCLTFDCKNKLFNLLVLIK